MYKILLIVISLSFYFGLNAQEANSEFSDVRLETDTDYEAAEPLVLKASEYILSTPVDNENMNRVYAIQLIMSWMHGTPKYTFNLDPIDKLGKEINTKTIYIASLVDYYLKHQQEIPTEEQLQLGALNIFLDYCENPDNGIKLTRKMKKMIASKKEGNLRNELNKK